MQRFEKLFFQWRLAKNSFTKYSVTQRCYSTGKPPEDQLQIEQTDETDDKTTKLSGFAKAFREHGNLLTENEKKSQDKRTFASLLRHSKFIDLGNPEGKIVTGKIYHIAGSDLYIDFGWKFPCVCKKPIKNADGYVRGAIVRLKIKDLELSTRFLGQERDLTLLEADCILLGLVSTPFGAQSSEKSVSTSVS